MDLRMDQNHDFYALLPLHEVGLEELFTKDSYFTSLPNDWYVLVADIKGSTSAIVNNKHNQVNLAATGCIVAILNDLKANNKNRVPYFFGGDGATFLIPNAYKEQLLEVLKLQQEHVRRQWDLELVIGYMSLEDIYNEGSKIGLARIQLNKFLQIPVVLGTGLKLAEELIKKTFSSTKTNIVVEAKPDLNGLQCRWDKIAPPTSDRSIICLLVYCDNEINQRSIYLEVLKGLTNIFGSLEERQPISTPKLSLDASFAKIKNEMFATQGRFNYRYLFKKIFGTYLGKLYFKYSKNGRNYLRLTKDLSETVMFDGLINTILAGTSDQIELLTAYLDQMESKGNIVYGLHVTTASIMSCYVEDMKNKHAHFVDGTEGGYTKAAEMLKSKIV